MAEKMTAAERAEYEGMLAHFEKFKRFMRVIVIVGAFVVVLALGLALLSLWEGKWLGLFQVACAWVSWYGFNRALDDYEKACVASGRCKRLLDIDAERKGEHG